MSKSLLSKETASKKMLCETFISMIVIISDKGLFMENLNLKSKAFGGI